MVSTERVVGSIADTVPDGWFTMSEVAAYCDRNVSTIKRWRTLGYLLPDGAMTAGKLTINLYSEQQREKALELAQSLHAGRPPKDREE